MPVPPQLPTGPAGYGPAAPPPPDSWYEPRTGDNRWHQTGDYAAYGGMPAPNPYPQAAPPVSAPPYASGNSVARYGGPGRAGDGYPIQSVSGPPAYGASVSGPPAYGPASGRAVVSRRRSAPPAGAAPVEDEPEYRRAITYTAAWYGVPGVLYLAWALTLESSRRSFVLHNFTASLFWLFGAAVLSLLVATILSWAAREWRSLTVSFAATVIGAGIATVAHSLALGT